MGNNTTLKVEAGAGKVSKFTWAKWNAPLILLLLSFAIMIVVILSSKSQAVADIENLAPYIMTALLCTIVVFSLTLNACASKKTEKNIQSVVSDITNLNNNLLQSRQANKTAIEQNLVRMSSIEDTQRHLLNEMAEFRNVIEKRYDFFQKTTQSFRQEVADSIEAVTSGNQTIQERVDGLLIAGKLLSGRIATTIENQKLLLGSVEEQNGLMDNSMSDLTEAQQELKGHVDVLREILQTIGGDVTDLAREQASLHETVRLRGEEYVRRLDSLSEDHTNVQNRLDQLGQNVRQASVEAVQQISQQVPGRESFQSHAEKLETQLDGLTGAQEQLRDYVNSLRELIQAVAEDVSNTTREEVRLHETVEKRGEESVCRLENLSEDHTNVRNHPDQIGENFEQARTESSQQIAQNVANQESFRDHAEALDVQLSGFINALEQLRGQVDSMKGLLHTVVVSPSQPVVSDSEAFQAIKAG